MTTPANPLPQQDLDLILDHTAELWDEVRGRRILLTGGTGFFGCWLVESFCHINQALGLGAGLTVLTRDPDRFLQKCPHMRATPSVFLHAGDIRNFIFPKGEFRYVVHCATETRAKAASEDPLGMFATIVQGTQHALEFSVSSGAQKFLLASSGAVYGRQPVEMTHVPETYSGAPDPLHPASVYGEGKRAAELLCALYGKKTSMECKIARCWAFCGPHLPLDQHFAIGNFIGDVLAGRPIEIKGDGTPRRSYLYAADLAIWLWTILFRAPALLPINVGSAHDASILELAQTVVKTLNPKAKIRVAQEAVPGAAPLRYVPSVERARDMLGLRETVGLEEGIRRTARWYGRKTGLMA